MLDLIEVHDRAALDRARFQLNSCRNPAEVGTRAAKGHIRPLNRWFAGTKHIDDIEALCLELLKKVFHSQYADHRLCASMIGNAAVYAALTQPGVEKFSLMARIKVLRKRIK